MDWTRARWRMGRLFGVSLLFIGCGRVNFEPDGDAGPGPVDAAMDAGDGTDAGERRDAGGIDGQIPGTGTIVGTVFEDIDYRPGPGLPRGTFDAPIPNVTVELYQESGFVASVQTGADGKYAFTGLPFGGYVVRVVSATIGAAAAPPESGFNDGFERAFAEQTFESNGVEGNGGGGALGGNDPRVADFATNPEEGVGDTNVSVMVGEDALVGVDFGFAYGLVVNTLEDGQGALRTAIANANAIAGPNVIVFQIPDGAYLEMPADPGVIKGVAVLNPTRPLPPVLDAETTIDGMSQSTTVGDPRAGPEVAIRVPTGAGLLPVGTCGLDVQGDGFVLDAVEIAGFDTMGACGLQVVNAAECLIANSLFRLNGNAADASGAALQLIGVSGCRVDSNRFEDNLRDAVRIVGGDEQLVVANGITDSGDDGIELEQDPARVLIERNMIGNNAAGIDVRGAQTATISGNMIGSNTVGLECHASSSPRTTVQLTENTFAENGRGVALRDPLMAMRDGCDVYVALGSFRDNGDHGIDLGADGVTPNDVGDLDTGPNGRLNFPVILDAVVTRGVLTVEGFTRAGTEVQIYVADGDPTGNGEGLTFVATETEGCQTGCVTMDGDQDPRTDAADIGRARFLFNIPTMLVAAGVEITATASRSQLRTSEFGPNFTVR